MRGISQFIQVWRSSCLALAVLLWPPAVVHAQEFQEGVDLRVCMDFPRCKANLPLDENQRQYVDSLIKGLPCGASPDAVARYFGRASHSQTPPTDMLGFGKGFRATWLLSGATASTPYPDAVDVDFINGRVFAKQWWLNKHRSKVDIRCRLKR